MKSDSLELLRIAEPLLVLLRERHVSRAAEKWGVTQPTMSRTLQRARQLAGDQLLVRQDGTARLTPVGEALFSSLREADGLVGNALIPQVFVPQQARGELRVAATDYVAQTIIPSWLARVSEQAPRLHVHLEVWNPRSWERLRSGDLHFGVNPVTVSDSFYRRPTKRDHYVVVLSKSHPAARRRLVVEEFAAMSHVLTAPEGADRGPVDEALARLGFERRVVVKTPDFFTAVSLVSQSHLVSTLPSLVVRRVSSQLDVVSKKLPLALSPIELAVVWHERMHRDPLTRWARSLFPYPSAS